MAEAKITQKEPETVFSKEQFLKSEKYSKRHDLLSVLLEDGKSYTKSAVDKLIDDYMKGGNK